MARNALDACMKLEIKAIEKVTKDVEARYKSLRERRMTTNKTTKEYPSEISLRIEKDWFIKVNHRTGKGRSKNKTKVHYRVNKLKNYNKYWPSLTPRK